jgi:1-acyl-sn-glycerol-3-phosphate acyltransferase
MSLIERGVAGLITESVRLLTGAQARWIGCAPATTQRIYFANHGSHADFALVWASLPRALRTVTRPVAGSDYWDQGRLRRYVIHEVLHGVLINRDRGTRTEDPIEKIVSALGTGSSLIVFPEGTRNITDDVLLSFKSGIYYVAKQRPDVDLVPVWIENARRVMPKGEFLPVPLLCSVNYGAPLRMKAAEEKAAFLGRLRQALLDLAASVRPS